MSGRRDTPADAPKPPARLVAARERALVAKVGLLSAALCAFGIGMVLVRVSHPGAATAGTTAVSAVPDDDFGDDGGSEEAFENGFGSGAISPGLGAPQTGTRSS